MVTDATSELLNSRLGLLASSSVPVELTVARGSDFINIIILSTTESEYNASIGVSQARDGSTGSDYSQGDLLGEWDRPGNIGSSQLERESALKKAR